MSTLPAGQTYVLNPTIDLQDAVQNRGLDPNAHDPHDYLKMVAKTFSAFKETSTTESTISYIHGLTVDYLYINKQASVPFLDAADQVLINPEAQYHVFRINPGACFIDDQFIEFDHPTIFLFDLPTDNRPNSLVDDVTNPNYVGQNIKLFRNLTYKIIIEYKWIKQFPVQKARIKIVVDEPNYDSVNYPYFTVANFCVDDSGNVIKCTPEVFNNISAADLADLVTFNDLVPITNIDNSISYYHRGINAQQLSKKYISNYKSLFTNIQDQMFNIFNQAGLGKSTFLVIDKKEVSLDLKSGTMIYFDQRDSVYKPAMSSRQKTDKIIGLYLYDSYNDTHIIFFSGMIDLDPDNVLINMDYKKLIHTTTNGVTTIETFTNRYGLTYNHPLVNLEVGNSYFLEDDSQYFNQSLLMYDLANYIEWDTRGFISTREYPGAVNVGYAVDRTKLLLNINQSNETDWNNAVDLYGNHKKFSDEYLTVFDYYKMDTSIKKVSDLNISYLNEKNNYLSYIGAYLNFNTMPDITSGLSIPINNSIPLPFVSFLEWFTTKYIIGIERFPQYSNSLLYRLNLESIVFDEVNTNLNIVYFNDTYCMGDAVKQTMVKDSIKTLKGTISLVSSILVLVNRTIQLYNGAITTLNSTIQSISNNQLQDELSQLVLIRRLELGDDPDNLNEVIEDVNSNIIRDLDIKYTDENQAGINLDTHIREDDQSVVTARANKILSIKGSISLNTDTINNDIIILNTLKTKLNTFLLIKLELEKILNRDSNTAVKLTNRISQISAEIVANELNIANFIKQKQLDIDLRGTNSVPALDIFYLNNYERKRYNYTYIVDRLLYEFSLMDSLTSDKVIASNKFAALTANGANEYDKELARLEVDRLTNRLVKNTDNIKNYTVEINTILKDFARPLITLNDKHFNIESDLINENPNNFRFGVDYGPVGSNNERYIINEAFIEVQRINIAKLKDGSLQKINFPDRFLPSVYTVNGSELTSADFVKEKFTTLSFSNNAENNFLFQPYFYIMLDKVKTLCYYYNGQYFIYSILTKPVDLPTLDVNNINDISFIDNVNKDIVTIDGQFYVYKMNELTFVKLIPVPLDSDELSRFVREARTKSVSEEYSLILTHVGFMNYFILKEEVLKSIDILNGYITVIQAFEIIGTTNVITVNLPVISPDLYPVLIDRTTQSYASYLVNRNHLNFLITLLSDTGSKDNLTVQDISDTTLINYGLGGSFRTESIEMRSQKLITIIDNYRTLLFNNIDSVILEIKKYRDTDVLTILSLNTELNA